MSLIDESLQVINPLYTAKPVELKTKFSIGKISVWGDYTFQSLDYLFVGNRVEFNNLGITRINWI